MSDTISRSDRSKLMAKVRSKHTAPEMRVRSTLHKLGYRFRLHKKGLPGTPDIVLPKYNVCIFINGCFWHRHAKCSRATSPKTNRSFWSNKFKRTRDRDRDAARRLKQLGWDVVTIWECK